MKQKSEFSRQGDKDFQIRITDEPVSLHNLIHELSISQNRLDPDSDRWLIIEDHYYNKLILENYADADRRKILEVTLEKPRTVMEILDICNIPQTSAYRKASLLIQKGLLVGDGSNLTHGRRVKYKPVFKDLQINIIKGVVNVRVRLTRND